MVVYRSPQWSGHSPSITNKYLNKTYYLINQHNLLWYLNHHSSKQSLMAVIIATPHFAGIELVLVTALASTFLLLLVALRSYTSCCSKSTNKEEPHNDKIIIVSPPSISSGPKSAHNSLSSTILSKDFFHNIEVAAFTPINRASHRRASLSDISSSVKQICTITDTNSQNPSQINNNIYQNAPSKHALPVRPQTALPVNGSVFVFPDTTAAPGGECPEYITLAHIVPAVSEVRDQRSAYLNAVSAVHGKRYKGRSRLSSDSFDSRHVVTYIRPQRRHSFAMAD